MAKVTGIPVKGIVLDSFPNAKFKIKLENGHIVTGYASGKMQMHFIRILVGDTVSLELSPYDLSQGRIIHREKNP